MAAVVRQARAVETRQALLVAAARVFERRGFAAARIEEILTEAGVTKGALYFHFDSKEALAGAIMDGHADLHRAKPAPSGSAMQGLIDVGAWLANALLHDPLARARTRLTLERHTFGAPDPTPYLSWAATSRRILELAEAQGELLPGVDPAEAAEVVTSSFLGVHLASEARTGRADLYQRMNATWRIILPGLVPAEVRDRLVLPAVSDEGGRADG